MNKLLQKLPQNEFDNLSSIDQRIIQRIAEQKQISRNTNREFDESLTFGQRLADRVSEFGGSWVFLAVFCIVVLAWVVLNSLILAKRGVAFDPYPYIFLNLGLSLLAAIQAPIIMMSQNRDEAKDRFDAAHDYEVNLKAELEILGLHKKIDHLSDNQWSELVAMQKEQIRLLNQLLSER